MEYLIRNEREPRNKREEEEVNMGNEGIGRGAVRAEPRMEEYADPVWDEDEFEEAYEHGNYQFSGRGFSATKVEKLEADLVENFRRQMLITLNRHVYYWRPSGSFSPK
ncbi:hypothetical protein GH714_006075 [Hevea brasiliensis]|uniref:Uncharacterized protein n=1 Tax=Hevea brasiliensis TaxID=3981 RepID=A0A6A6N1C0_HEVBR|nr:hypothetical protein GH714_006075 [Hevea brasiliensis]